MANVLHRLVRLPGVALLLICPGALPAQGRDALLRVPPGFTIIQYATVGGAGTSLSFGPDTRDPEAEAPRLYATDYVNGRVARTAM